MKINSRKELKGLLDWYEELKSDHKYRDRRSIITLIFKCYQTTTFNENLNSEPKGSTHNKGYEVNQK